MDEITELTLIGQMWYSSGYSENNTTSLTFSRTIPRYTEMHTKNTIQATAPKDTYLSLSILLMLTRGTEKNTATM